MNIRLVWVRIFEGTGNSGSGNRESGIGNRGAFRWLETLLHKHQRKISH
ncbi:MAG: hypothetical protein F6J98_36260 [Moorea sp. SIO4G2]|nr:hypothetical protein [Moorena sp. SIO4G2]